MLCSEAMHLQHDFQYDLLSISTILVSGHGMMIKANGNGSRTQPLLNIAPANHQSTNELAALSREGRSPLGSQSLPILA